MDCPYRFCTTGRIDHGSGIGHRSSIDCWSANWSLRSPGFRLSRGSACPEGSDCSEWPSCSEGSSWRGDPEDVGFLWVGLGMSAVLFLFYWFYLPYFSKMCISAHQTASATWWLCKPLLHQLSVPCFHTPRNWVPTAIPMGTLSVTVQKSADRRGYQFVLSTFWHSSAQNCSLVYLLAALCRDVTCAEGLGTISHDNVTFMLGNVHCVVA